MISRYVLAPILSATVLSSAVAANPSPEREVVRLSLEQAVVTALRNNRDLQIEQLNPAIARATLSSSYGWYDPLFIGDVRRENDVETGGFDPANFSADAVYRAHSELGNANILGYLPSGMSYTLSTTYAHSDGERNSLDFDTYRVFAGATVRQPLLRNFWIDPGRYVIKVNKQNVKLTEHGVRLMANIVVNQVEQAYYELIYAYESQKIQQELVRARTDMLSGTRRRMEEGMATLPDVQLAEAQLATAQTAFSASLTDIALAENALRTALGDSFTNQVFSSIGPSGHLLLVRSDFDLQQSWNKGLKTRPDLAQMIVELEKSNIEVRFRHNQLFPALDIIAGYGRRGSSTAEDVAPFTPKASLSDAIDQISDAEAPKDMVGVALTMPLTMQTERGLYKASRHVRAQAQLRLKQKEELVLREISDAYHTAQTSFDRAKTARMAVESSTAALNAEQKRLSGGTSSIFFVLQLQNDLVSSQLTEARARADYNKALAQWRYAEGTSIDPHGIALDVPPPAENVKKTK